jgi:hypothetical protein
MVFRRRSFARQYTVCSPTTDDKKKVSLFTSVVSSLHLENLLEYLKIMWYYVLTDNISKSKGNVPGVYFEGALFDFWPG